MTEMDEETVVFFKKNISKINKTLDKLEIELAFHAKTQEFESHFKSFEKAVEFYQLCEEELCQQLKVLKLSAHAVTLRKIFHSYKHQMLMMLRTNIFLQEILNKARIRIRSPLKTDEVLHESSSNQSVKRKGEISRNGDNLNRHNEDSVRDLRSGSSSQEILGPLMSWSPDHFLVEYYTEEYLPGSFEIDPTQEKYYYFRCMNIKKKVFQVFNEAKAKLSHASTASSGSQVSHIIKEIVTTSLDYKKFISLLEFQEEKEEEAFYKKLGMKFRDFSAQTEGIFMREDIVKEKFQEYQNSIQTIRASASEKDLSLLSYQTQLNDLAKVYAEEREEISEKKKEIERQAKEIARLETQVKLMNEKENVFSSTMERLKKNIDKKGQEIANLKETLENKKQLLRDTEERFGNARDEWEITKNKLDEEIAHLNSDKKKLRKEIEEHFREKQVLLSKIPQFEYVPLKKLQEAELRIKGIREEQEAANIKVKGKIESMRKMAQMEEKVRIREKEKADCLMGVYEKWTQGKTEDFLREGLEATQKEIKEVEERLKHFYNLHQIEMEENEFEKGSLVKLGKGLMELIEEEKRKEEEAKNKEMEEKERNEQAKMRKQWRDEEIEPNEQGRTPMEANEQSRMIMEGNEQGRTPMEANEETRREKEVEKVKKNDDTNQRKFEKFLKSKRTFEEKIKHFQMEIYYAQKTQGVILRLEELITFLSLLLQGSTDPVELFSANHIQKSSESQAKLEEIHFKSRKKCSSAQKPVEIAKETEKASQIRALPELKTPGKAKKRNWSAPRRPYSQEIPTGLILRQSLTVLQEIEIPNEQNGAHQADQKDQKDHSKISMDLMNLVDQRGRIAPVYPSDLRKNGSFVQNLSQMNQNGLSQSVNPISRNYQRVQSLTSNQQRELVQAQSNDPKRGPGQLYHQNEPKITWEMQINEPKLEKTEERNQVDSQTPAIEQQRTQKSQKNIKSNENDSKAKNNPKGNISSHSFSPNSGRPRITTGKSSIAKDQRTFHQNVSKNTIGLSQNYQSSFRSQLPGLNPSSVETTQEQPENTGSSDENYEANEAVDSLKKEKSPLKPSISLHLSQKSSSNIKMKLKEIKTNREASTELPGSGSLSNPIEQHSESINITDNLERSMESSTQATVPLRKEKSKNIFVQPKQNTFRKQMTLKDPKKPLKKSNIRKAHKTPPKKEPEVEEPVKEEVLTPVPEPEIEEEDPRVFVPDELDYLNQCPFHCKFPYEIEKSKEEKKGIDAQDRPKEPSDEPLEVQVMKKIYSKLEKMFKKDPEKFKKQFKETKKKELMLPEKGEQFLTFEKFRESYEELLNSHKGCCEHCGKLKRFNEKLKFNENEKKTTFPVNTKVIAKIPLVGAQAAQMKNQKA